MRTWLIRSKVMETEENANVPMLYSNICNSPPTTERPTAASLKPYDAAAPLVDVELALEPVPVLVVEPSREVASFVALLQTKVP